MPSMLAEIEHRIGQIQMRNVVRHRPRLESPPPASRPSRRRPCPDRRHRYCRPAPNRSPRAWRDARPAGSSRTMLPVHPPPAIGRRYAPPPSRSRCPSSTRPSLVVPPPMSRLRMRCALARHARGAGAVGGEHGFHMMARQWRVTKSPPCSDRSSGDALRVLAPQRFAGQDDRRRCRCRRRCSPAAS